MHRDIRSFVVRAGRMSDSQKRALANLMPRFGLPAQAPLDWDRAFDRSGARRVVEIGFGMGTTLAQMATNEPTTDFLGIEVHPPGAANLMKLLDHGAIGNVRVIQHDAVEVFRSMLAPQSIDAVHIYFPDPWPKKRHHKRRLLRPALVHSLAARLRVGGLFHMATDWQEYAEQTLATLSAEPLLRNQAEGFAPRPAWRPITKFETRGLRLGHGVWDVLFERVIAPGTTKE